jgi:hypothetical protein
MEDIQAMNGLTPDSDSSSFSSGRVSAAGVVVGVVVVEVGAVEVTSA